MAPEIDLGKLEGLDKAGTPRPWSPDYSQILGANGERVFGGVNAVACEPYVGDPDTELICAAVNALPALIQRLREAEFQVEGIRTAMHNAQTRIAQLELAVAEFLGEDRGGELYKRRKLRSALDGKDRPWYTNDPDDPSGMIPR